VQHLCNKALLLQGGQIAFSGIPNDAINFYLNSLSNDFLMSASHVVDLWNASSRPPKYHPTLKRMELYTEDGAPFTGYLTIGASLQIQVTFRLENPTPNVNITLMFENNLEQRILDCSSEYHPLDLGPHGQHIGDHTLVCDIPSLTLLNGEYRITVCLDIDGVNVDRVENAVHLSMVRSDYYGGGKLPRHGYMVLAHSWRHERYSPVAATKNI